MLDLDESGIEAQLDFKNINFSIEDMGLLDRWLKALLSDVYLHTKNAFEGQEPGTYQLFWGVNKLKDESNGGEMDTKSQH